MNNSIHQDWLQKARDAANRAYAPYSQFRVGAILITKGGKSFQGCNVENASFGLTICAERVAACSAIAAGQRDWHSIYIVSPTKVTPCGACRQFLAEFDSELMVHVGLLVPDATSNVEVESYSISQLLPSAMSLAKLKESLR